MYTASSSSSQSSKTSSRVSQRSNWQDLDHRTVIPLTAVVPKSYGSIVPYYHFLKQTSNKKAYLKVGIKTYLDP